MTSELRAAIQKEIDDHAVVIYMKGTQSMPMCGFSAAAVEVLKGYGVPIHDVNVLADPQKWQAMKEFSQWPTMPQIYIGGTFVGGCDIVREMHAKGELGALVEGAVGGARNP